mmetsp:Transcript_18813/g.43555  ORF Transcript_18813/g.43555 Transcript_18813/m.43555 type:complete len:210 (-) Transcript_18813:586-1215(-)
MTRLEATSILPAAVVSMLSLAASSTMTAAADSVVDAIVAFRSSDEPIGSPSSFRRCALSRADNKPDGRFVDRCVQCAMRNRGASWVSFVRLFVRSSTIHHQSREMTSSSGSASAPAPTTTTCGGGGRSSSRKKFPTTGRPGAFPEAPIRAPDRKQARPTTSSCMREDSMPPPVPPTPVPAPTPPLPDSDPLPPPPCLFSRAFRAAISRL